MKALLVVDMLKDFVLPGAPLEVPKARRIVPAISREIDRARREGRPVVYVNDSHRPDDPEFAVWPSHAVEGTEGARVVDELAPGPGDLVVKKRSYSGFYGTDLEAKLREMGVDELTVTGVVTNICVLYTSVDAMMRGFRVEVPEDCVAALNDEDHRFALRQLREVLKPARG
jgi:nicotinamidase-related amidase